MCLINEIDDLDHRSVRFVENDGEWRVLPGKGQVLHSIGAEDIGSLCSGAIDDVRDFICFEEILILRCDCEERKKRKRIKGETGCELMDVV